MKKLYEEPYFYAVLHDEKTNDYFLDVTCGTSAMFEFCIKLNAREVKKFLQKPDALDRLAYEVRDAPGSFLKRKI